MIAFADELRAAGHTVHTPDLYDGRTFGDIDAGVANAKEIGFDNVLDRGITAAQDLPNEIIYAGLSLGVMPAQKLAQTRPDAKGALLFHGAITRDEFGAWPEGLSAQIHMMDKDPWAEEDLPAATELAAIDGVELFLYPGDKHLFADNSLPDYDDAAAILLRQRVLKFLDNSS